MIKGKQIPEKGTLYAAFTDHIIFDRYEKLTDRKFVLKGTWKNEDTDQHMNATDNACLDLDAALQGGTLLELHVFDHDREYRCIKMRTQGYLEFFVDDDSMEPDDIYTEQVFISEGEKPIGLQKKTGVVNYIRYTEDDLLRIINYRLQEVE